MSYGTTNAELIAGQLADAADVQRIWGGLMYSVVNYGIVGDGVTNNTSALQALINEAIAAGRRTIFFPHGVYFVSALTNADKVDFVGDNSTFTGGYSGEIANLGSDAALKAETVTGIINVATAYGAKGDWTADDTQSFKDALAAAALTGATVYVPRGRYRIMEQLTIPRNVNLICEDRANTILDFSEAIEAFPDWACMFIAGEGLSPLPALAANISKSSKIVTFASAPSLKENDLIQIYNTADYSYSGFRGQYRAGEFAVVYKVTGNSVELVDYPLADYTYTTPTIGVEKVINPATCRVENITVIGRNTIDYCVRLKYGRDCVFKDVISHNSIKDVLSCSLSYNISFENILIENYNFDPVDQETNRGLSIHNSQEIRVNDSYLLSYRHGLNLGGSEVKGVVNRNIIVNNCTIKNLSTPGSSMSVSTHGNTERLRISNSILHGIIIGGDYNFLTNNTIYANNRCIHFSELKGISHTIQGNELINTDPANSGGRGCLIDMSGASDDLSAFTTHGGLLRIVGNRCNLMQNDTSEFGFRIRNRGCTASLEVLIENNIVRSGVTSTGSQYGLFLAVSVGSNFKRVSIRNNDFIGWGLNVANIDNLRANDNDIISSGREGITAAMCSISRILGNFINGCQRNGIQYDNGAGYTGQEVIYLRDNIVTENNISTDGTRDGVNIRRCGTIYSSQNHIGGSQAGAQRPATYRDAATLYEDRNNYFGTGAATYTAVTSMFGRLDAAIPDTSGAALAALETEVNKLKAEMRAHRMIAM